MGWHRDQLTYCSNVHPYDGVVGLLSVIEEDIAPVRVRRRLDTMHASLWISAEVLDALSCHPSDQRRFRDTLSAQRLELHTLNGFPMGGFHAKSVKDQVYLPNWSQPERLSHTLALAHLLRRCLPDGVTKGTLSTLPLGFRRHWSAGAQERALKQLRKLVMALARLEDQHQIHIQVCLEMEPGCVLQRTDELIRLFTEQLPCQSLPDDLLYRYLGVCYDVCHQAIMFEDSAQALSKIMAAGIDIGKIQFSNGLRVDRPQRQQVVTFLRKYCEPRYLHQTVASNGNGVYLYAEDLPDALEQDSFLQAPEWRIHYHTPLHQNELDHPALATTGDHIEAVCAFLAANPQLQPHLEVETYTWEVLPEAYRPRDKQELTDGLAAEIEYIEQRLNQYQLLVKDPKNGVLHAAQSVHEKTACCH